MPSPAPRLTCWRCRKPQPLCLCDHIPVVRNRTGIILLQHRKERDHPLGTARIVRLGLERSRTHVLLGQDGSSEPVALPPSSALLYPSADAADLATLPVGSRPANLVILDATWPLAHQLYRDNPWIRALPHVRFSPAAPSRYRIRPEPRPECVSTLEAAIEALRVLEPDLAGLDGLLQAFDHMIDAQVGAGERVGRPRQRRPRRHESRRVPERIRAAEDRVVVAMIEPGPRAGPGRASPLHWTAVRWRDGVVFDEVGWSGPRPGAEFLEGLGLPAALPIAEARASAFAEFCGPDAVILCWSRTSRELASTAVGAERVHGLKPVWTNAAKSRSVSHLDAIVRELGLDLPHLGARGRAGRRLACTDAMARHLRRMR